VSEVTLGYRMMGLTVTSGGEVVMVEDTGPRAEVYSLDLDHLRSLNVPGAVTLFGITSKGDVLFIADYGGKCIHVVMENHCDSCSHSISLNWKPVGVAIQNYTLFVIDMYENILYKIQLDKQYSRLSADQVLMTAPDLYRPIFLDVSSTKVTVTNYYGHNMTVTKHDGTIEWTYGSFGTADDQLRNPRGVVIDRWNRYILADGANKRVVLLSEDGQFLMNLAGNLGGGVGGLDVIGNAVYVNGRQAPYKLFRLRLE
jgi:hypothetical protein